MLFNSKTIKLLTHLSERKLMKFQSSGIEEHSNLNILEFKSFDLI